MKRISILHEDRVLFVSELGEGRHVIGRDPDVDIHVDHGGISRHHARLIIDGDNLSIEDLRSSNGTFVNDVEVGQFPVPFGTGSHVMIGTLRLSVADPATDVAGCGQYSVGGLVAHGGMGNVLSAIQTSMRREVAMKVIRGDATPAARARFLAEARVTGSLEHPNIVPVHEIGRDADGEVFYTMKFVRGETLAAILQALAAKSPTHLKQYPLARLLTVFQKVCDAVGFAHSKGILHRDLKPENIMIGDFGEVQVMDWGLAKRFGLAPSGTESVESFVDDPSLDGTLQGSVLGTPQYMSPEQARGEVDLLDARSDVYALGAILYEMIYLKSPREGGTALEIVERVAKGEKARHPKSWRSPHLPGGRVPRALKAVSKKAMSFLPENRYPDVHKLQEDISAYQAGHATSAQRAGVLLRLALFIKRHQAVSTAVGLAVFVLGILSIAYSGQLLQQRLIAERAREAAETEKARAEAALMRVEEERVRAESALEVAMHEQRRLSEARADLRRFGESSQAMRDRIAEAVRDLPDADAVFAMLHGQAVRAGDVEEALANINRALERAPSNPDYLIARANLYQATGRFSRAVPDYQRALAIRPDPFVEESLTVTKKWMSERENDRMDDAQLKRSMEEFLSRQKRLEALLLDEILKPEAAIEIADDETPAPTPYSPEESRLVARIGHLTSQSAWNRERLKHSGGGRLSLDLSGMDTSNLSGLKGNGVVDLNLAGSNCDDLSVIAGMKLESLVISGTKVTDLGALRGMPLKQLDCSNTAVADFSILAGCPLEVLRCENLQSGELNGIARVRTLKELHVGGEKLASISLLKGLSLKSLRLVGTQVADLRPLAGMPLESLEVVGGPMDSLEGIEGLPLRQLTLSGTSNVKDFRLLGTLVNLESLALPPHAAGLGLLKKIPGLKTVDHPRFGGRMEASRFIMLSDASDAAWAVIAPALKRAGASDLRPDRLTVREPEQVELDLRGTALADLRPLTSFPLHRLMIDTPDEDLDLAPLAGKEELRHLCLVGTKVRNLLPMMRGLRLESIAVSHHAADTHYFGRLPTLKWIGYHWDNGERRATTPRDEFFAARQPQVDEPEGKPGTGALAYSGFDDFLKGVENWTVVATSGATTESVWLPDTPPAVGNKSARGGGCLAARCPEPTSGICWFRAPESFLGNRSRAIGGGIEIHLRRDSYQSSPGLSDVELVSGNLRLVQVLDLPNTSGWRTIMIPLDASGGWLVGGPDGPLATDVQIRDVLTSLREFLIRANQGPSAGDRTCLDDVTIWSRADFQQRKQFHDTWQNQIREAMAWAVDAEIRSADSPDVLEMAAYPKVLFDHGAHFAEEHDGKHGVLLVHPVEVSTPAVIRLPSPPQMEQGLEFVFEAKASVQENGSFIHVVSGGEVVSKTQVNGGWAPGGWTEIRLPVGLFKPEEPVEIEIHPIGWAWEACRIHRPRWIVRSDLMKTGENGGETWSFTLGDPGNGWETPDYDDRSWEVGKGAFGRMDQPDTRIRTTWETRQIWLRGRFNHTGGDGGILQARVFHDEDAKIYLNGSLVADLRGHVRDYRGIHFPSEHLRNGENIIAVQCEQTVGEQFIDVGLTYEKTFEKPGAQPIEEGSNP